MKKINKIISFALCIVMLISSLPVFTFAVTNVEPALETEQTEEAKAIKVAELEEKRDIYTKFFETSEGTNVAVTSSVPLHYEENGELIEIDNTLVKSKDDNSIFTNISNTYDVELPEILNADSNVSLNYNGTAISFKLLNVGTNSSKISIEEVTPIEVDEFDAESVAYAESNLDDLTSSAIYKNAFDNTDIEYAISPDTLKENIILNSSPHDDFSIRYELNADNSNVILNEDNSISIVENGVELYVVESPYMFDAAGVETDDISVSLEKVENVYYITYVPSAAWLSNATITYPVTVDPTIAIIGNNSRAIEDTFVTTSTKTKNKSTMSSVTVQTTSSTDNWGYYKINNLPNLPQNSRITNCSLHLSTTTDVMTPYNIALYALPEEATVSDNFISTLTWNNKISPNNTVLEIAKAPRYPGDLIFDITNLASKWYENSNLNRVLVLKAFDGTSKTTIASCEDATNSSKIPYISVEYSTINGIDKNYQYHTQDIGLAGTAYINDYTGNLIVERTEFTSNGSADAIKFYMGSGVNSPELAPFGNNISTNYYKTLTFDTLNENADYVITNGDGSKQYISIENDNVCMNEISGNEIEVSYTFQSNIINDIYSRAILPSNIDKSNEEATYVLVRQLVQKNNMATDYSEVEIEYQDSKIISICDEITLIEFNYTNDEISSIITNPNITDEELISENSDNFIGTNSTNLEHSNNTITVHLYNDNDMELPGVDLSYEYDNSNNITKIISESGVYYEYTFNENNQVTEVKEYSSQDVLVSCLTFSYEDNRTIISDGTKTYTEYFDNYGKLVSVIDQDGNAVFSQYKGDLISKTSKTRNSARNIADFYGFESNTDTFFTTQEGIISVNSNEKHTGISSLKFTSSVGYMTLFSKRLENLKHDTTYTVSMWLKSDQADKCRLELTNGDNNGIMTSSVAENVDDWQRISCTINTDNSNYINVRLIVNNEDITSPIITYIDDMYVQQSPYLTNINLIANGDFTDSLNNWVCSNANSMVENVTGNISTADANRLKLIGNVTGVNTVSQVVDISAPEGTKYNFGGWVKAIDALPEKEGTNRELSISVYAVSDDDEVLLDTVSYSTDFSDWQYIESEFALPFNFGSDNDYSALKFVVSYNYQYGTAYFDGLSLSKDELFAVRFIYNSSNEIVGIGSGEAIIPVNNDLNTPSNTTAISNKEYDAYGNISKTETYTNVNFTTENATEIVKRCISNQFNYSNKGSLLTQEINTFGYCTDYKYDYYGNISYINDVNGCITEFEYDNFQNLSAIIKNFDWKDFADDHSKFYEDGVVPEPSPDKDSANIITQEELESTRYKSYSYISEETYDKDNTLKIQYYYNGKQLVKIDTILYTLVVTKTKYEVVEEVVGENNETHDEIKNKFTLTEEDFDSVNTYEFEYDDWGNLTAIYANDENHENPFVEYVYDSINYRQLNAVRYINGREINYVYDNNGNVIYKYDSDNNDGSTLSYSYYYYDNGDCYGKKNLVTGEITSYQDGLTTVLDSEGKIIYSYGLDENKNKLQQVGNNFVKTVKTNNSQSTTVNGISSTITKTYDDFGRVISERMHVDGNDTDLLKVYYYYAHGYYFTEGIIDYNIENDYTQETSNYVRAIIYYVIDADTEYDYLMLNDVEEETHSEEFTEGDNNSNSGNEGVDTPNEEDTEILMEDAFSETNLYWLNGKMGTSTSYSVTYTIAYSYNSAGMLCQSAPIVRGNDYRYDYSAGGNITDINYVEYTGSDILNKRAVTKRNAHLLYDNNSGTSLNNCLTNIKWFNVNINSGVETLDEEINLSYDALGNMITYISDERNMELNWCRGNVLNSVNIIDVDTDNSSSEYSVSYKYDDNNIRTEKIIDLGNNETITIKYVYEENVLVGTTIKHITANTVDECDTIVLYDMDNNAYGFVLNKHVVQDGIEEIQSDLYYYIKGTDGAIHYVVGSDMSDENVEFVEYSYDDFGLPQMTCSDNSEMIAIYNPLIYKDYVYDWDTSMYYVNSRYYAPKTYRYISADLSFGRNNYTVLSTNLYAYCDNDPINQKVK